MAALNWSRRNAIAISHQRWTCCTGVGGGVVKGGHEVVALAFAMRIGGQPFVLIMDDAGGRRMVRHRLAHLARFMTGTAGLVARCHTRCSILTKADALGVLEAVRASQFRVADDVIDSAIEEVLRH